MSKRTAPSKQLKLNSIKRLSAYDFIDLGCGDGASLVNFQKKIGGKGLGVELDRKKVKVAWSHNRNVALGNALDLHKIPGKVDYVTCDNFLEHLLSFDDVEKMLEQAIKVSRKFVYIRHPSFDGMEYLNSLGLKTYWSDWTGHTSMLKVADIIEMLHRLGVQTIKVVPVFPIKNSDSKKILPIKAKPDQHDYDSNLHGPKPSATFDQNIHYAFDIVAMVPGSDDQVPKLIYKDRINSDSRPTFDFEHMNETHRQKQRTAELEKQLKTIQNNRAYKILQKGNSLRKRLKGASGR